MPYLDTHEPQASWKTADCSIGCPGQTGYAGACTFVGRSFLQESPLHTKIQVLWDGLPLKLAFGVSGVKIEIVCCGVAQSTSIFLHSHVGACVQGLVGIFCGPAYRVFIQVRVHRHIALHAYLFSGSVACFGQGTCTDAGFCACDPIWRGLSCQLECPLLAGVPCAGKSEKRDG